MVRLDFRELAVERVVPVDEDVPPLLRVLGARLVKDVEGHRILLGVDSRGIDDGLDRADPLAADPRFSSRV